FGLLSLLGCESAPKEPAPRENPPSNPATPVMAEPQRMQVAQVPISPDDPLKGKFSLAEATDGLGDEGKLTASIETDFGTLNCELYEDKAPITVANFVGLARRLRPFKDGGQWVKRPGYDGSTFHRIGRGFMIQGGDPKGEGTGEPGYVRTDESWPG